MRAQTPFLRDRVRSHKLIKEQLAELGGAYAGRECWLLATGPSLGTFAPGVLRKRLRDELVIAVKQAYSFAGLADVADFHLINAENLQEYEDGGLPPIRIATTAAGLPFPLDTYPVDAICQVKHPGDLCESIAATGRFADWTFDRTPDRPFGPGIVYEIGFYLAVHLGVERITTIGIDLATPLHCYDDTPAEAAVHERLKSPKTPNEFAARSIAVVHRGIPKWWGWLRSIGILWDYVPTSEPTALAEMLPERIL